MIVESKKAVVAAPKRRTYTEAQRRQILEEAAQPGVSVSAVARRHGINDNIIYTWRKQRRGAAAVMLPVTVAGRTPAPAVCSCASDARIEIRTIQGHVIKVGAGVDVQIVQAILTALK